MVTQAMIPRDIVHPVMPTYRQQVFHCGISKAIDGDVMFLQFEGLATRGAPIRMNANCGFPRGPNVKTKEIVRIQVAFDQQHILNKSSKHVARGRAVSYDICSLKKITLMPCKLYFIPKSSQSVGCNQYAAMLDKLRPNFYPSPSFQD